MKWTVGFPAGTTPVMWFIAGPQDKAANDDKVAA